MALQGTIQDFALPDIFQLIGIQRKTGVLSLENGSDRVSVKFFEGQVVGADTRTETLEDRLGTLLVRTRRITDSQLQDALRVQKNTLQRLGHILVSAGYISEEDLVEALRVQSTQIIYRLFRWRDGTYHFDAVEDLDYDQKHFTPISSETILMEGARMIDEWPIIERNVKSPRMLLRKTELAHRLEGAVGPATEFELGFDYDRKAANRPLAADRLERPPELVPEERAVLALVDGKRTVEELCDLSALGEFDTYRILSELLKRGLLEEMWRAQTAGNETWSGAWRKKLLGWAAHAAVALLVALALGTLRSNPLTPWKMMGQNEVTDRLRLYASLARLERLEKAIQIFYLNGGAFPKSLAVLVHKGYVEPDDLADAWGRPYRYDLSAGGFQLFAEDAAGQSIPDLAVSRRFNPAQRMMLAGQGTAP